MWLWIIGAIGLVGIVLLLLLPLLGDEEGVPPEPAANVTITDIVQDVSNFEGQTVILDGEATEVIGENAFVLSAEEPVAGGVDAELLIVGARQDMEAIDDQLLNDRVVVGGVVRQFDLATFEEELGFDLDDAAFEEFAGRPAIIAEEIIQAAPEAAP